MKLTEKKGKGSGAFGEVVPSDIKEIFDNSKENYLKKFLSEGLSNRILFEKFINFRWPLWLESVASYSSDAGRSYPNLLLLNTSFREWQTFNNYLSKSEITVDRSGMISGPSGARWSLEFWIYNNDRMYRLQDELTKVKSSRNTGTGEIIINWQSGGISFTERIAGSRSSVDEVIVSVDVNVRKAGSDSFFFAAVRPYNNTSLGGLTSIEVDSGAGIVSINGKGLIGFDTRPDEVVTGSGTLGDVEYSDRNSDSVQCSYGMATAGLKYRLDSAKKSFHFRVSLNAGAALPGLKFNYENQFREFGLFSEMRLSEGIKAELTDNDFSSLFLQSRLSLLNINHDDLGGDGTESFRKLYFFVYALCRAGSFDTAEAFFSSKLDSFIYDRKRPVFEEVIKGSFLIKSCNEIFIHKRETGFLQVYYQRIKGIAEFIYRYSVEIHNSSCSGRSTNVHNLAISERFTDTLYIFSAITDLSYLARAMGIFGDESKFKNESLRLQSILSESLNREDFSRITVSDRESSILSLPERVLYSMKQEEYRSLVSSFIASLDYPVVHPLFGVDMFYSAVILNHLYTAGFNDSNRLYKQLMEYIDDFYVLPEFIDYKAKRGSWGDGNSKIINAVIFSLLRNRLFIDSKDRLELFPVPDSSWFKQGCRLKIENAASRYGIISLAMDISDKEIRLSFGGSPKYIPPDILINLPYNSSVIQGDDFIVKKKIGHNYIISGWPSSVRFSIS